MNSGSANDWSARSATVLIGTYNRFDIAFSHGRGAYLYDTEGKPYVDFAAGIAVSTLGHSHPGLVDALTDQAEKVLHVSNLYQIPQQIELAERLQRWLEMDRFFFCNSGTEANEALIKFARAWGHEHGKYRIVVARDGFHGRTLGALSATAQESLHERFGPMLEGFDAVPYGSLDELEGAVGPETAAVLLEPLQAEGGAVVPEPGYLKSVAESCRRHGILFLLDEVQTGVGRLGSPLACHAVDVVPDAVSLAKGLGGGVPIGALAVQEKHAHILGPRSHGSTFGGNPLACRAAQVVVDTLTEPGFLDSVLDRGNRIRETLSKWNHPWVSDVRGRGLFVAFTTPDGQAVVRTALEHGLLAVAAKNNTVRLLPPLTVSEAAVDDGLERLKRTLDAVRSEAA